MSETVTLKKLADLLGVSVSTVGRSLADRPEISEKTKARVRALADAQGYVAHSAARSMRTGTSTLVGLIVPDVRNEFYASAAMALARCCDGDGFQLMLAATRDDPDSELRQVRSLVEARAAGVVVALSARPRRETLSLLARVATVELIREAQAGMAWFGIDDRLGIEEATTHLIGLGHRRIAYVGGHEGLSTGRQRIAGLEAALRAGGIELPPSRVRLGPPDAAFAQRAVASLWGAKERPTALVAAGAELTTGAIEAVGRLGISVPHELSIVGFGDAPWFRWWGPGLTTMALPAYDLAFSCGDFLLRLIREANDERGELAPVRVMHAPTLTVRGSTANV